MGEFERATAVEPGERPGRYRAEIAEGWDIGGNAIAAGARCGGRDADPAAKVLSLSNDAPSAAASFGSCEELSLIHI